MTLLSSSLQYRRFARRILLVLWLAPAIVQADIIFTAKVAGPVTNIYAVDKAGNLKKITDNVYVRDLDPFWSSGWVSFSSSREQENKIDMHKNSEDYDVYVVRDDGKSLRQITDSEHNEVVPRLSPDGKQIGYLHQPPGKHELRVISRSGKAGRILATADTILDLSWSPDGNAIAYASTVGNDSMLMVVELAGAEPRSLAKVSTAQPPAEAKSDAGFLEQIASVLWSPTGDRIAYIIHPLKQGAVRQLRVYDLKTGNDFAVSPEAAQVQHPVVWDRGGARLLYSALVGYKFYYDEKIHKKVYEGGMHIFLSSLEDGKARTSQLTAGDFLFRSPVFSPDEKQIAFLYADALDERQLALKTMNIDGSGVKQWYDSAAPHSYLQWK